VCLAFLEVLMSVYCHRTTSGNTELAVT
jgi:hypothetical protein